MVVSIGNYSRETMADIAFSEDRVLYRTGARSVKDMLASELSKFLLASTDLADTFARILMENDADSISDFLRVRNIGVLPADLLEALDRSNGALTEEDEEDSTDEASVIQIVDEHEARFEETPANSVDGAEQGKGDSELPKGGVLHSPPTPTTSPLANSGVHEAASGSQRVPSSNRGIAPAGAPSPTTRTPTPPHNDGSATLTGAPFFPARSMPVGAQGDSGTVETPELARNNQANSLDSGLPAQTPSGSDFAAQTGLSRSHQTTKGPWTGQNRRSHSQPSRTKTGRLLSYAAGPGAADKPL